MHRHHPDRGGTKEEAQEINTTYERLKAWVEAGRRRPHEQGSRFESPAFEIACGLFLLIGSGISLAALSWIRQTPLETPCIRSGD